MKRLLIFALLCWQCSAQMNNTTYQKLATGITTAQTPYVTNPVTNLGQAGHLGFLIFSGGGCSSINNGTAFFEGSFDKTNWIQFGTDGTSNMINLVNIITAEGPFP